MRVVPVGSVLRLYDYELIMLLFERVCGRDGNEELDVCFAWMSVVVVII